MNNSTRYQAPKQSIENEAFWKKHIEAHAVCTMSKSAYCQANQVDYPRFMYWSKKITPTAKVGGLIAIKMRAAKNPLSDQTVLCTLALKGGDCLHIYDERVLSVILEKRC
jgi:hypothetical protein